MSSLLAACLSVEGSFTEAALQLRSPSMAMCCLQLHCRPVYLPRVARLLCDLLCWLRQPPTAIAMHMHRWTCTV